MNIENINSYTLKNLDKINIILGKNGCGKSILLRKVEEGIAQQGGDIYGKTRYITPERGGSLTYEAGVEQNTVSNTKWLSDTRRKNQFSQFKEQSVAQFRRLETIVLREIEKERREEKDYFFDQYIEKINSLLDNIYIKREGVGFKIFLKEPDQELNPEVISSGESELISLGIECLIFSKEIISRKENILFLDEPDVHLHPDLQYRLMQFLKNLVEANSFRIIIATHSTAILGSLETYQNIRIAFMRFNQKEIEFSPISDVYKKILPVFGAHPLSNIFNKAPILLLEGEDDERIWQQVVRASQGRIKIYPCSCGGIDRLNSYEKEVQKIINSVYDDAKAYSLRDRDDDAHELKDLPPVIRMEFSCRSAENLLLSDEVLRSLGVDWSSIKSKIDDWVDKNNAHPHYDIMKNFKDTGYNRKDFDLKEIRNDLMGIIGNSKPWEVAVGQTIAGLDAKSPNFDQNGSIYNFLGEKVVKTILG